MVRPEAPKYTTETDTGLSCLHSQVTDPSNKANIKKINGVFQFNLSGPDAEWVLDLKEGSVAKGKAKKSDVTLSMKDSDFVALMYVPLPLTMRLFAF